MHEPGDIAPGFTAQPRQCWTMVYDERGWTTHCTHTVVWRGVFRNVEGKRWTVDACEAHAEGLERVERL
jgi:hypothetical protein